VDFPDEQDWLILIEMMSYIKKNKDVMVLSADDSGSIIWHINLAFAVHNDKKNHAGATMSLGGCRIISVSMKQKANT
jgi:hypothetical protein